MTGPDWLALVPTWLLATWAGLLGLAIGSFINVVVYRVPAGLSVVHPPSACPSCGHVIRNRDNVPVLGWLLLRGRCRDCAAPISARYPAVEAATGAAFVAVTLRVPGDLVALAALLVVTAACIAHTLIDLEHGRLPFSITRVAAALAAVPVVAGALVSQTVPVGVLIGAGVWLALYGLIWLVTFGSGMGLGDVALAPLLGGALGLIGLYNTGAGLACGFVLGGIYGVGVMVHRRALAGRLSHEPSTGHKVATETAHEGPAHDGSAAGALAVGTVAAAVAEPPLRGTAVPFGPFMVAGAAIGLFAGDTVTSTYLRLVGLS